MNAFSALPRLTHSRRTVAAWGLLFALAGAVVAGGATVLLASTDRVSGAWWFMMSGFGTALVVVGLTLPLGLPGQGSPARTVRVYKFQAAAVTLLPLAATAPVLLTSDRPLAALGTVPAAMLVLALRADWGGVRRHVEQVQSADDPSSVRWVPAATLTRLQHALGGPALLGVGGLVVTFTTLPRVADAALGTGFLVGAVAVVRAAPHCGSARATVRWLRVGLVGLSGGYVTVAAVSILGSDLLVAGAFGVVGVVAVVADFAVDWGRVRAVIARIQAAEPVTWERWSEARAAIDADGPQAST